MESDTDTLTMGEKRSRTIRARATNDIHSALALFEAEDAFPITLRTLAIRAGVGAYVMRCLADTDEVVLSHIEERKLVPSSRGKRPAWSAEDADRINPEDGRDILLKSFLNDEELDVASLREPDRTEFIEFVTREVTTAYGTPAIKHLRNRLLEQIGTHHQTVSDKIGAVVELSEVKSELKLMDRRWNDRLDQLFKLLPSRSDRPNGSTRRGVSSPPPVDEAEAEHPET